jgi:hypothetical protein
MTLLFCIVLKTNPEVDPVKRPGPGFYGSTRVNPHLCKDMYVRSLQIKQNITPADVIPLPLLPLPLLLSNALLHLKLAILKINSKERKRDKADLTHLLQIEREKQRKINHEN